MMGNVNLTAARKAKNDEFYTQYEDIAKEVAAYVEYNPDVFRNKTVLLPCDDYSQSNFTKYFTDNFERLGLHKLISTCYVPGGHGKLFVMINHSIEYGCLVGDGDFRSEEVTRLRDEADMIITNPPFSLFREFLAWIQEAPV
jgi:hypothetical protein